MQILKYILIVAALLFAFNISEAQKKNEDFTFDTVLLKSGEKVTGVIIDVYHDHYVDIIDENRDKIRIIYRDIQSIKYGDEFKGKVQYKKMRSQMSYHVPGKKIYFNIGLDLHAGRGQSRWVEPGRGLSFSTGYRFSNKAIVGVGVGLDTYTFDFTNTIAPIFAEYRYEFMDRSFTPFATMRAGVGLPVGGNSGGWNGATTNRVGGYYLNPLVGVRLRTQKKGHFQFALGWKIQDYKEDGVEFYSGPNGQWLESIYRDKVLFSRFTLNAGLMF